jgi:Transglutaminase-like superfamily
MNSVAASGLFVWPTAIFFLKRGHYRLSPIDRCSRVSGKSRICSTVQNATRAELNQIRLPAEILARADEAAQQFEQRAAQFNQIALKLQSSPASNQPVGQTNSAQAAPETGAIDELNSFFTQYPNSKRPAAPAVIDPTNPKKLPWSTPQPNKRLPAETKAAWLNNLHKDYYAAQARTLAQAGNISGLQFTQLPEPGVAPTAADLAETDKVKLTTAVRAKALELGNNPVQIHNWVRNTVQWQPTWGAMQNAGSALQSQRGNAFDIASLEIALLRAAGIPARY